MVESLEWMDQIFEPGENMPARWREVYFVLVEKMRKEAEHIPMNTVQLLQLERIAKNYVILRIKEDFQIGNKEGFLSAAMQKDFNTFWLNTTHEFNNMLLKSGATDRAVILSQVRDMLVGTIQNMPEVEPRTRAHLLEKFALGFEELGVL